MCIRDRRILMRTVPVVELKVPEHLIEGCGSPKVLVYEQYPNLELWDVIPAERSGRKPAELKHLSRCRIRQCLYDNYALPHGIRQLPIPTRLQDYVDLLED